jgi:hypothetical protein
MFVVSEIQLYSITISFPTKKPPLTRLADREAVQDRKCDQVGSTRKGVTTKNQGYTFPRKAFLYAFPRLQFNFGQPFYLRWGYRGSELTHIMQISQNYIAFHLFK